MNNLYRKNLKALSENFRNIDTTIINKTAEAHLIYEQAKNGNLTAKLLMPDTKSQVYLHSAYDPDKEAEAFANGMKLRNDSIVVLYGLGLGYQARAILRRMHNENRLIVIEPDFSIVKSVFRIHDFTDILEDARVFFMINHPERELRGMLRGYFDMMKIDRAVIRPLQPYTRIFIQYYNQFVQILNEIHHDTSLERNSILKDGPVWQNNIIMNLDALMESLNAGDFKDKFKDVPAVIVSAGPSLDKNVDLLKQFKTKSLIIAAYTALRKLLSHGIVPDLVAAVDGRQLILENERERKEPFTIPLLYLPVTDHRLITKHKGPKILGLSEKDGFSALIASRLQLKDACLLLGGSVACTIMDFAARAGCNPIIFAGQDLSYPAPNKTHAAGTHQASQVSTKKRPLFEVEDVFGKKVLTDDMLLTYAKWMEKYIAHDNGNRIYIDATEGGMRIRGTDIMTLADASRFATEDISERFLRVLQSDTILKQKEDLFDQHRHYCRDMLPILLTKARMALALSADLLGLGTNWESDVWTQKLRELTDLEEQITQINQDTGLYDWIFKIAHIQFSDMKNEICVDDQQQEAHEKAHYFQILIKLLESINDR